MSLRWVCSAHDSNWWVISISLSQPMNFLLYFLTPFFWQILVVGSLQGWLLWEDTRSCPHVRQSHFQPHVGAGPVVPWRWEPMLEQIFWQDLWPPGGSTQQQSVSVLRGLSRRNTENSFSGNSFSGNFWYMYGWLWNYILYNLLFVVQ